VGRRDWISGVHRGNLLSREAEAYKKQNPSLSDSQLLDQFGGIENNDLVWTEASLRKAKTYLIGSYVTFVLFLSASIFGMTEWAFNK
jgi:hypothetical protein